ncbi:MAG: L-aspartate oxidase [FCB group bacterium]|nr:L-aspartate oxidase [FCB group bacterium]
MKNSYDFMIIGSGIAGLSYALKVAEHGRVVIITKKQATESSTNYAQGGIASVMSSTDSFEAHLSDTLNVGAGLCRENIVRRIIEAGPECIQRLIDFGVKFTRQKDSDGFSLGREGGHTHKRVVHAADLTGREIERALLTSCREHKNITIRTNHIALDLITYKRDGISYCGGAFVYDPVNQQRLIIRASLTLLATGGAGQVYRYTTNPLIATGDGIAMAFRAGAQVANLEFVQFHPTTLSQIGKPPFLISEAVRGEGGILRTASGKAFMDDYHPMKDLAPRDIVARAIDSELKRSGHDTVYLDLQHLPADHIKIRFPNIYIRCLEAGIDITHDLIPVVPAAHYICGGVVADINGRTEIERLYVCGETACTGMHGANRLASNSLLEAVATAQFAASESIRDFKLGSAPEPLVLKFPHKALAKLPRERVMLSHNRRELKRLMWDYVGIVRTSYRLDEAASRIDPIRHSIDRYFFSHRLSEASIELRNMATVAWLIIESASMRKESRGLQYITDYPQLDDVNWKKDTILRKQGSDYVSTA